MRDLETREPTLLSCIWCWPSGVMGLEAENVEGNVATVGDSSQRSWDSGARFARYTRPNLRQTHPPCWLNSRSGLGQTETDKVLLMSCPEEYHRDCEELQCRRRVLSLRACTVDQARTLTKRTKRRILRGPNRTRLSRLGLAPRPTTIFEGYGIQQ